jgi:hypothetical protein
MFVIRPSLDAAIHLAAAYKRGTGSEIPRGNSMIFLPAEVPSHAGAGSWRGQRPITFF